MLLFFRPHRYGVQPVSTVTLDGSYAPSVALTGLNAPVIELAGSKQDSITLGAKV